MNGPPLRSLLKLRVLYDVVAVAIVWRAARVLSARLVLANLDYDEKYFLWTGWSLLKGGTPYRDFHAFKPPMGYLINAAAIALFGLDGLAYRRLFEILAVGSILSLLVALLKRGVDRVLATSLALLVAGLYFEFTFHDSSLNDTESIGLAFYILGIAAFVWPARRRWIGQGLGSAMLAAAVLTKEPFAFCVLGTWLAFLFDHDHPLRWKNVLAYLKPTLLGAGAVVAAVVIHLAASGALPYYLRVFEQYEPFARTYCVSLGSFTPGPFWSEQKQNWDHLSKDFLDFPRFAAWMPLFVAAYTTLRRRALFVAGVTAAVIGAIYSTTLGHCFWRHYYVMAFAGAILLGTAGAIGLSKRLDSSRMPGLRRWVRALLAVSIFFVIWPRYSFERDKLADYKPAQYGGLSADLVEYVRAHSGPADYVLTTGDPAINVMADRRAPPYVGPNAFLDELLPTYPGKTDEEKLAPLRAELGRAMPTIVYLDPDREYRRTRFLRTAVEPFLRQNGYHEVHWHMWMR